jgi:hypothetical protein
MKDTCDIANLPFKYKAENYHYVGGSYGQCSEKKLMEELYKNGPIVVSFEPDYNFMMYKSGIYHSIDEKTWISKRLPKPEWEKVDHSVLLVGWGEDENSEKFWIIQNTWGPNWGEQGFFRMKRGVDEFGIESICEAADPYIIDRTTNKLMTKKDMEELNKVNYNGIHMPYNTKSQSQSQIDSQYQDLDKETNGKNRVYNNNYNNENIKESNSIIDQLDNLEKAENEIKNNPNVFNENNDNSENSIFQSLD